MFNFLEVPDNRVMKYMALTLLAAMILGCEAPQGAADPQSFTGSQTDPAPVETPEPVVEPPARKPLLSAWSHTGASSRETYTVDLSGLPDLDPTEGIATDQRVLFVFPGPLTCSAYVRFNGNESLGTVEIAQSLHTGGSQSANDRYCDPLEGNYDYSEMAGNQLRMCKRLGGCVYWQ
jgi:hypothetical protein